MVAVHAASKVDKSFFNHHNPRPARFCFSKSRCTNMELWECRNISFEAEKG